MSRICLSAPRYGSRGRSPTRKAKGDILAVPRVPHSPYCPVQAVLDWQVVAGITTGPLFRRLYRGDRAGRVRLTAQSVALVIKRRAAQAGLKAAGTIACEGVFDVRRAQACQHLQNGRYGRYGRSVAPQVARHAARVRGRCRALRRSCRRRAAGRPKGIAQPAGGPTRVRSPGQRVQEIPSSRSRTLFLNGPRNQPHEEQVLVCS